MRRISKTFVVNLCLACSFALSASSLQAQTNRQAPMNNSDLARQNYGRVGASATEIQTVLVKDPGLMVEMKPLAAKVATQQGQGLIEQDLTPDAIFARLVSDGEFRSIATQLLQRYGYLVPQLNPDSVAGKEQDMLSKERAKLIAADEQESDAKGREKTEARRRAADYGEPQNYDPQIYQQCLDQQRDLDRQQYPAQYGPNQSPQDQRNGIDQYGPSQPDQQ